MTAKIDPACFDEPPEEEQDFCSSINQLETKDSYAWPSGRRQLLPFNCDCENKSHFSPGPTGQTDRNSRAKQKERARKLAQARERAEVCDIPEFCPPPSAICSPQESDDEDGAGHRRCGSYIGYSPFNICLADWMPKSKVAETKEDCEKDGTGEDCDKDDRCEKKKG